MANINDTTKYLDLTGLTAYDILIKKYSDDNDAVLDAKIDAAIGEGGNVAAQIETAIDELKGTLSETDSSTLEAINDELDGIDTVLETLNGDNTTEGSVAKSIKDAIEDLDVNEIGESGKAIIAVSEANGLISATAGDISASHVTTSLTGSAAANVQQSLEEIYGLIEDGQIAVYADNNGTLTPVNSISEFGTTYVFKQGTNTIATMNYAQDMVVSGGTVVTATAEDKAIDENVEIGQKYIKLSIANSSDILYIPVNALYKDHTAAPNAEKVQLAISSDNVISADIVSGSIEKTDLTIALQQEISSAATVVNEKNSGHVTVSVTAASGSNPAQVTVQENDIASAQDLSNEVVRAKAAESEIAGLIGLTGNEGSKTYSTNSGKANVVADINDLDGRIDSIEAYVGNMTAISSEEITALFAVSSGD